MCLLGTVPTKWCRAWPRACASVSHAYAVYLRAVANVGKSVQEQPLARVLCVAGDFIQRGFVDRFERRRELGARTVCHHETALGLAVCHNANRAYGDFQILGHLLQTDFKSGLRNNRRDLQPGKQASRSQCSARAQTAVLQMSLGYRCSKGVAIQRTVHRTKHRSRNMALLDRPRKANYCYCVSLHCVICTHCRFVQAAITLQVANGDLRMFCACGTCAWQHRARATPRAWAEECRIQ